MITDIFQSCGHCWVFQICWHIEWSTFTASTFRIWNSSTGIPSPPLALFIVMLSKANLTSHSRMSGSMWVITPSRLSWLWSSFLYSSSVYSCHLFLSSASVRSIPSLSFFEPIFAWNVPLVSLIFLKRSLVFPILLFSSISLHWSLSTELHYGHIKGTCPLTYNFDLPLPCKYFLKNYYYPDTACGSGLKAVNNSPGLFYESVQLGLGLAVNNRTLNKVRMWELDHNEGWALRNWCFWTVVLERILEKPLDSQETKRVNPKGNQPWIFIGRTDAEAPVLRSLDAKRWLTGKDPDAGKDWGQEEKGMTEDAMVWWHHWVNGHEFEQTQGHTEGQGNLVCYIVHGVTESQTWLSDWTTTTNCEDPHRTKVLLLFHVKEAWRAGSRSTSTESHQRDCPGGPVG